MKECSKSIQRRLHNPNFSRVYFKGIGIDIGGGSDPLSFYEYLFPLIKSIRVYDKEDGDAQVMSGVQSNYYDFVHSSHCLEHLEDPVEGISNWFRILKPDGYLIITIPDEDLYEQGVFPSTFNADHKWTFTIFKGFSWSTKSINIIDIIKELGTEASVEKIELLNTTYRHGIPRYDQTRLPTTECGIEIIIRKRTQDEIFNKKREYPQPNIDDLKYFNQYIDDNKVLKESNKILQPFNNYLEI